MSRDRAGAYAEGAKLGAPDAVQVADRWHLLKNLSDALYKLLQHHQPAIQQQFALESQVALTAQDVLSVAAAIPNTPEADQVGAAPFVVLQPASPTAADRRRQERAAEAHRLHEQGWTAKAIASHLQISAKTVGRYLNRPLPLAPLQRSPRGQLLDPYKPYLLERWNAGCHNAAQLLREIQAQGFQGQATIVRDFIGALRQASGLPPRVRKMPGQALHTDPTTQPPSLRALTYLTVQSPDSLEPTEQQYLARLSQVHPQVASGIELGREFVAMVRQRQPERLDAWLERAAQSEVAALRTFAAGLQRDYAAVRAGLALPWSNEHVAYCTSSP